MMVRLVCVPLAPNRQPSPVSLASLCGVGSVFSKGSDTISQGSAEGDSPLNSHTISPYFSHIPSHLVVLDEAIDIPECCETNEQRLLTDIVVLREGTNAVIIKHINAVDTLEVLP